MSVLIESYFQKLKDGFKLASADKPIISKTIQIHEFVIKMNFAGASLVPVFFNAFDHLEVKESIPPPSLELNFYEEKGAIDIPWFGEEKHHLGLVDSYTNNRFYTLHQPESHAIYMLDTQANLGYYRVSSSLAIPYWESDFPLRMILHWWLKNTSFQPVHAAAVGNQDGGILLVGKGGSGKSTSTLSCIGSNLKIAGDDYVLLDCDEANAYSLFSLTKLTAKSIGLLPNLHIDLSKLSVPHDGKYRIKLFPRYENSLTKRVSILSVMIPSVTGNDYTSIEPCGSGDIMRALAPTTLLQLPGLRNESFEKMSRFVKSVPGFHLKLGKDIDQIPGILERFISAHALTQTVPG